MSTSIICARHGRRANKKVRLALAHNVLLMRRRAAFCAMWRSPNDRQGVKRISFVVRRGHISISLFALRHGRRNATINYSYNNKEISL